MLSRRGELLLRCLQQFRQRLLCRRQCAEAGRNWWRTDLVILFIRIFLVLILVVLFIIAPNRAQKYDTLTTESQQASER